MEKTSVKKLKLNRFNYADVIIYALLILFAFIALYPFYYVIVGSFNEGEDFLNGGVYFWPRIFSVANYVYVFNDARLYTGFFITVSSTILGTAVSLIFTACVAYGMSRKELKFRNFFYWANMFTMFFGGGLIPTYVLMVALGLYENYLIYIIPGMYSVYNMIVFSNFFKGIPEELREAAVMDGASEFRIMFTIIFRLSGAVFATVGLWVGVGKWNSYYNTMIYCPTNKDLQTLQYYLLKVIKESSKPEDTSGVPSEMLKEVCDKTVSFAAIVIATIPIMCVFPFLQKLFGKGVMVGSLKG